MGGMYITRIPMIVVANRSIGRTGWLVLKPILMRFSFQYLSKLMSVLYLRQTCENMFGKKTSLSQIFQARSHIGFFQHLGLPICFPKWFGSVHAKGAINKGHPVWQTTQSRWSNVPLPRHLNRLKQHLLTEYATPPTGLATNIKKYTLHISNYLSM